MEDFLGLLLVGGIVFALAYGFGWLAAEINSPSKEQRQAAVKNMLREQARKSRQEFDKKYSADKVAFRYKDTGTIVELWEKDEKDTDFVLTGTFNKELMATQMTGKAKLSTLMRLMDVYWKIKRGEPIPQNENQCSVYDY